MDVDKGMCLMILMFIGTHMISLYTFLAPCPQVLDAVGSQQRNGTQTKQLLLQGTLLGCWSLCTASYFYTKCASWQHWHMQLFWWRIRKHFFYFTVLPSDNFTTAFTVSLEQWTFWSSFKAIGSTLLLHCCNYDILYNIFTAFQDKELHFFLNTLLLSLEKCLSII